MIFYDNDGQRPHQTHPNPNPKPNPYPYPYPYPNSFQHVQICDMLERDMFKEGLEGRTVTLKLKTVQFEIITRTNTVPNHAYVCKAVDISKHALPLLEKV